MRMDAVARRQTMWKVSKTVSEFMHSLCIQDIEKGIEKYLLDISYPGMNVQYRKKFIKEAMRLYPPNSHSFS